MPLILSHLDVRVRDRAAATLFYDSFLAALGAIRRDGEAFTTWSIPSPDGNGDDAPDWFGIVEDRSVQPSLTRIAFAAPSRGTVDAIATILPAIGAQRIEMDDGIYGDDYYAVFFEDPDGNRLEVCATG